MSGNIKQYLTNQNIQTLYDKRFTDTLFGSIGRQCTLKLANGEEGEGVFYTMHPKEGGVVINNFKSSNSKQEEGIQKVAQKDDFSYVLIKNVEDPPYIKTSGENITQKSQKVGQSLSHKIKTDRELGKKTENKQRVFESWDDEEPDVKMGDLEAGKNKNYKANGQFNQFEVNEKQFGLNVDYDENQYTTELNMSEVSKELQQKAEKAFQELQKEGKEGGGNRHILEDRGLVEYGENEDEEAIYSAVLQSGRYQDNKKDEKEIKFSQGPPKFNNSKKDKQVEQSQPSQKEEQQQQQAQDEVQQKEDENNKSNSTLNQSTGKNSKKQMKVQAQNFVSDNNMNLSGNLNFDLNNSLSNQNSSISSSQPPKLQKKKTEKKIGNEGFMIRCAPGNKQNEKIFSELLLDNLHIEMSKGENNDLGVQNYSSKWEENKQDDSHIFQQSDLIRQFSQSENDQSYSNNQSFENISPMRNQSASYNNKNKFQQQQYGFNPTPDLLGKNQFQ